MSDKEPPVTRWHFVRHAPVRASGGLTYAGPDEPADLSDRAALRGLAARLPKGALWLTSGLKRAIATADALIAAGAEAADRRIEPDLAEQHYGACYGLDWPALETRMKDWPRHNFWFMSAATRPEGGESFLDVMGRVGPALARYGDSHAGRDIVAVCHGGSIRAALACALGLDPERALGVSVETLSVSRLDRRPGPGLGGDWRLVYLNRRPGADADY